MAAVGSAFPFARRGVSHFTLGQAGWEEVADYALVWAETNATTSTGHGTPVTA